MSLQGDDFAGDNEVGIAYSAKVNDRRFKSLHAQPPANDDRVVAAFALKQSANNAVSQLQARDWQIGAAKELLAGRDSFVITATGSGKTLCYQLALLASPGKMIIGIFPLISLMKDQVIAPT